MDYNHAAAFAAYCRGNPPEIIAEALVIPLQVVQKWIRAEGWARLSAEMKPSSSAMVPVKAERDLERIQKNRDRTLVTLDKLTDDFENQVALLVEGKLQVERITPKGIIVKITAGLAEREQLMSIGKTLFEARYRALGDAVAADKKGEALPSGAATIHIHLPAHVSEPRPARAYVHEAEAIPVESVVMPEPGR